MAVYNPPPQVLFEPVTSFYKGKAIRQQLAAGEQEAELKGLQIEAAKQEIADAPSKREAAKRRALLEEENIRSQISTRVRTEERTELELNANLLTPLLTDYAEEEDEDKALRGFNRSIQSILPSMSETSQEQYAEAAGPDHSFSHDEVMLAGLGVRAFMDEISGDRTAQKFIDRDGNPVQGSMDKQGNYYDSSGVQRTDITPIAPSATQADIGGLSRAGLSATTIAFRDQVMQASAGASTATELVKISYDSPAAMAKSGSVITFGNELYVTAKNLVKTVASPALPKSDTAKQTKGAEAFDWGDLDDKMESLGVTKDDAARWKSGVYSIAFSAAVGEQGSRPSDKDIQAYITIYGGQITDPSAFRATVAQAMRRQYNMLRFTAELNPEIEDRQQSLSVFEGEYNKFLEALDGGDEVVDDIYSRARAAIEGGADPDAVRQRLIDNGADPSKL